MVDRSHSKFPSVRLISFFIHLSVWTRSLSVFSVSMRNTTVGGGMSLNSLPSDSIPTILSKPPMERTIPPLKESFHSFIWSIISSTAGSFSPNSLSNFSSIHSLILLQAGLWEKRPSGPSSIFSEKSDQSSNATTKTESFGIRSRRFDLATSRSVRPTKINRERIECRRSFIIIE